MPETNAFSPILVVLKIDQNEGNLAPHNPYEGIDDTFVQLPARLTSGLIAVVRGALWPGFEDFFHKKENTMSESVTKPVKQELEEETLETRGEVKRLTGLTIFVIVVTVLSFLVAVHAQDKYTLKSPSGI